MPLITIIFILNFSTYLFMIDVEMWWLYDTISDIEKVLLCAALFLFMPRWRWREKIGASVLLMSYVAVAVWNVLIDRELITHGPVTMATFYGGASIIIALWHRLNRNWDKLPVDTIRPGYFYEIIGKPKSNIQWIGFILSIGKGGSFALTDGKTKYYFSKSANCFKNKPWINADLSSKKVIEIGPANSIFYDKMKKMNNHPFTILNNCLTKIGVQYGRR